MTSDNNCNNWSYRAEKRAWLVCIGLAAWAVLVIFKFKIYPEFFAIFIFYTLLLLNTFFSIRLFATITPKDHFGQRLWDILLFLCLIFLPFFFNVSLNFVFMTLLLFVAATLKYIFLMPIVGFSKLLFEKIRIDTLGILLCLSCLAGLIIGFTKTSLDLWTLVFFLANVYVLWYKPIYLLENHVEKFFND
jgi:hypothetical protein